MKIFVHNKNLTVDQINKIESGFRCKLNFNQTHYRSKNIGITDYSLLKKLRQELKLDINLLPDDFNGEQIKLIISDMDSTLINIECIDELAEFAGIKPKIAAITEATMQGKLDFNQSLMQRVKLLKGLAVGALDVVYQKKLKLNDGAVDLINTSKNLNIKFALVSGGFNYFTNKLQAKLGLDFVKANNLEISQGKLTGNVTGAIINSEQKKIFLNELCNLLKIKPNQTIAIGDGANDLLMLKAAGLSVAYKAKPKVKATTMVQIDYSSLASVLDFLA